MLPKTILRLCFMNTLFSGRLWNTAYRSRTDTNEPQLNSYLKVSQLGQANAWQASTHQSEENEMIIGSKRGPRAPSHHDSQDHCYRRQYRQHGHRYYR